MKDTKLRIGNKGEGRFIKIPFKEPETLDEFASEYGENEPFLVQSAMRGVRIRIQDLTRETVSEGLKAGKSPEAVQKEVLDLLQTLDITEKKERQAPVRKPKEVAVPEGKQTFSRAELDALLAANGIKTTTAGAATAGQPA